MLPKLIVILGPTGSGKTELALKLAKKYRGEIVGADSRQIYKEMAIGTDKPAGQWLMANGAGQIVNSKSYVVNKVPYHLADIIKPDEDFSLAVYKQKAVQAIFDIINRGKTPFLVGGTALYINAVVENLYIPRVAPNPKLRKKFENDIEKYGLNYLWQKLIKLDPGVKKFVQKNNSRRIIRALEVCTETKTPFSKLRKSGEPLFETLKIALDIPREKLYQKIDKRVDEMIKEGLVSEVKKLIKKYPNKPKSLDTIGYQEIIQYLKGKATLAEAIQKIKFNTHAFVRYQMSWFRKDKKIKWIKDISEAEKAIKDLSPQKQNPSLSVGHRRMGNLIPIHSRERIRIAKGREVKRRVQGRAIRMH